MTDDQHTFTVDDLEYDIVTTLSTLLQSEQVIAHCREAIAGYKKPRHVHFVDTLPRNAVGKVLKHQLAEQARAFHSEARTTQG